MWVTEPDWVRQEKLTIALCRRVRQLRFRTRNEAAQYIFQHYFNDLVTYISWVLVVAQHREANRLTILRQRAAERRRIRDQGGYDNTGDEHVHEFDL